VKKNFNDYIFVNTTYTFMFLHHTIHHSS